MKRKCKRCGGNGEEQDSSAIGETMRRARRGAGLTLAIIAKRGGVTASYLCDLENGRRHWGPELIALYRAAVAS